MAERDVKEQVRKYSILVAMEYTDLSLGPPRSILRESMNEADVLSASKRNMAWAKKPVAVNQISNDIELQLNQPLPQDWEQCLDLQSGNMYYLNRKSMKKSWVKPREQNMDLDLNSIPKLSSSAGKANSIAQEMIKSQYSLSGNMVALVCVNCHLLVMLSRSSPSCPNCKYLHSLSQQETPRRKLDSAKPLRTLSLLH